MRSDVRIRDVYVDGTGQDIIGQEKVEECTHPLLKLMMHSNCINAYAQMLTLYTLSKLSGDEVIAIS